METPLPCVMPWVEALKSKMKSWSFGRRASRSTAVPASSSCCWRVRLVESRICIFDGVLSAAAVKEAMTTRREDGRYIMTSWKGEKNGRSQFSVCLLGEEGIPEFEFKVKEIDFLSGVARGVSSYCHMRNDKASSELLNPYRC
jgi:hypothetical protein